MFDDVRQFVNLFPAGFPDARGSDLQSLGSTRHSPWSRLELGGYGERWRSDVRVRRVII